MFLCTLLLTYPTQTPLLFSGSRLDRQWFLRFICAQRKIDRIYARIYMPHTTRFRYRFSAHFLNLSIYCRLYKGLQDPVSFTVTTGLLGRLGLGLRVRVSIRIIFTFFSEFIINLFRYCNKSRYERHLSNVSLNGQSKCSRKIVSCCRRLPWIFTENIAKRQEGHLAYEKYCCFATTVPKGSLLETWPTMTADVLCCEL